MNCKMHNYSQKLMPDKTEPLTMITGRYTSCDKVLIILVLTKKSVKQTNKQTNISTHFELLVSCL